MHSLVYKRLGNVFFIFFFYFFFSKVLFYVDFQMSFTLLQAKIPVQDDMI